MREIISTVVVVTCVGIGLVNFKVYWPSLLYVKQTLSSAFPE